MKRLFPILVILAIQFNSFSQNYPGYSQDNYSGVHAGYTNPAFIADNRLLVDVNVASLSLSAFNDYIYFSPRNMPYGYFKTFASIDQAASNYVNDTLNNKIVSYGDVPTYRDKLKSGNIFEYTNASGKSRNLFYNHELAVLNVMVNLDEDVAFSFGIKQRTFINADYVAAEILSLARTELEDTDFWGPEFNEQSVKIAFNTWNEFALGAASVIYNEKEHFIKTGLNLKFLQGVAAAFISTDDLKYSLLNGDTAATISGGLHYGYSDNLSSSSFGKSEITPSTFGIDLQRPFAGAGGIGFGVDLGVVYEWRPKYQTFLYDMDGKKGLQRPDVNKYRLRAAFAINDLGGIKYQSANDNRKFEFTDNLTNFDLNQLDADDLEGFNNKVNTLVSEAKAEYVVEESSFFMNTPAHITASVDYLVVKNFYVNANALLGMPMYKNPNRSIYRSNFAITPRYEHPFFSVAVPMSYSAVYGPRIGLSTRLSPYIAIGTSNLKPFFSAQRDVKVNGLDLFVAFKVPIAKRVPRDTDRDLVSDKVDLCIKTPGTWQFKGCPDTDNDGVQDSEDRCPTEAGKIERLSRQRQRPNY